MDLLRTNPKPRNLRGYFFYPIIMKANILGAKILYEGFLKLRQLHVEFLSPFGKKVDHRYEVIDQANSAACLLWHSDKRAFILVKQFRAPVAETNPTQLIEIPAGRIEKNEKAESCIRRELREETGFTVSNIKYLGSYWLSPGASNERITLFFAEATKKEKMEKGGGKKDEHEFIQITELSLSSFYELLRQEKSLDAKTILAFLLAKEKGLLPTSNGE